MQWLQSLLSPGRKMKTEPNKHIYAIEYPEPLVHFALSLGSFSDPAVCIYFSFYILSKWVEIVTSEIIWICSVTNDESFLYRFESTMPRPFFRIWGLLKTSLYDQQFTWTKKQEYTYRKFYIFLQKIWHWVWQAFWKQSTHV